MTPFSRLTTQFLVKGKNNSKFQIWPHSPFAVKQCYVMRSSILMMMIGLIIHWILLQHFVSFDLVPSQLKNCNNLRS